MELSKYKQRQRSVTYNIQLIISLYIIKIVDYRLCFLPLWVITKFNHRKTTSYSMKGGLIPRFTLYTWRIVSRSTLHAPCLQQSEQYEFNFQQEVIFYLVGPNEVYRHAALGPVS